MNGFEIIAHRGVHDLAPENTLEAFQRAIELGADGIECDVRLTADRVPIIFHWFYFDVTTTLHGAPFDYTFDQLRSADIYSKGGNRAERIRIPTLRDVLDTVGGKIGLEIEIKGPEPESAQTVGDVLDKFKYLWETIEITSYEPMLLWHIQQRCPGLATDLLFPRSEDWMREDVVTYLAIPRARLARARAVNLHPTQLSPNSVSAIREHGIQVHAWDVNDLESLELAIDLGIPRICTDEFQRARDFICQWKERENPTPAVLS